MSDNFSIQRILTMRAYTLADHGACMNPDAFDSIGARFLLDIRDEVVDAVANRHDEYPDETWTDSAMHVRDGDAPGEIADGAVPIYTGELWATFTDLGAWEQDVSDFGEIEDMTKGAQVALYMIARQLVDTLLDLVEDDEVDDDGLDVVEVA